MIGRDQRWPSHRDHPIEHKELCGSTRKPHVLTENTFLKSLWLLGMLEYVDIY